MRLHTDLSERVVVDTRTAPWTPSPQPGVERILLEREGQEVARATSIVRYAAGSRFTEHEHGGGEEILVLEGEFRDEHGAYPAGTYLRNPAGTRHSPFSTLGCLLFVKLRQIAAEDRVQRVIGPESTRCPLEGSASRELLLHETAGERVSLARWGAGYEEPWHVHPDLVEILVLEGEFADEQGSYGAGTWLRLPARSGHQRFTRRGCLMWLKRRTA